MEPPDVIFYRAVYVCNTARQNLRSFVLLFGCVCVFYAAVKELNIQHGTLVGEA